MERLAHICGNWGAWGCHPVVSEFKRLPKRKSSPSVQTREELEKLDEICKKCKSSYFIVKEETCPVCNSKDVEIAGISHSLPGMEMTHGFRCNNENCETLFWVHEKDLKIKMK
ncbi:MAG: hypothetical protein PVF66_09045 [Candidatus Aminicenantes bacterium]|jgi:hypothetical protein